MTVAAPPRGSPIARTAASAAASALAAGLCAAAAARAALSVAGDPKAPWVLGRAAGLTAYLLLVALTLTGLLLAHPRAARLRHPHPVTRLRLHAWLAAFTLAFVALHVVALATDRFAHVGWAGALIPMASAYRPLPVTFGVLAMWAGLIAGATAALAGRGAGRWWWPVHRLAASSLVLVVAHGLLAGSDAPALRVGYATTALAVLGVALSRYLPWTRP